MLANCLQLCQMATTPTHPLQIVVPMNWLLLSQIASAMIRPQETVMLIDWLEQICHAHLASLHSSRAACFEEFENVVKNGVKNGVNVLNDDPRHAQIYHVNGYNQQFSGYIHEMENLKKQF